MALHSSSTPRLQHELASSSGDLRESGDIGFDQQTVLQKRRALKSHPAVQSWIDVFWRTYRSHNHPDGIARDEYIRVHRLMTRALHRSGGACHKQFIQSHSFSSANSYHSNLNNLHPSSTIAITLSGDRLSQKFFNGSVCVSLA